MREYIVFVSKDHYNPVGIVRTLGEAGIKPIVIAVKGDLQMVTKSKYIKEKYFVNSSEEGLRLIVEKYAKNKEEKSFILTGDDVTVSVLDQHYNELKDYFFFYNAGESGRVRKYLNKDQISALAVKHGFNIPKTWKVKVGEIPFDIEYPIMTKAIHSFGDEWKNIVYICENEKELCEAYCKIRSKELLLQKYIKKVDEQSYEGFSINHGKNVAFTVQNNEIYHIPDKYAPFWKHRNVDDVDFMKSAGAMIEEIGFEGIFEFEFMIGSDGKLYFLEVNLRNTANGWGTTVAGMPGVTLWCRSMLEGKIVDGWYQKIPDGFVSMAECFDYDVRVKSDLISKREWLRQYKATNAKLYRGRNDFAPFFSFMWYKFKKNHLKKGRIN